MFIKKRYYYKNWEIIIDKAFSKKIRARVYIINKSDFIFRLKSNNTQNKQKSNYKRYFGKKIPLERGVAKRFTLHANFPQIAEALIKSGLLDSFIQLSNPEFRINDGESIFSFKFPREADVLALYCTGGKRNGKKIKTPELIILDIMTKALDILAEWKVIDININ